MKNKSKRVKSLLVTICAGVSIFLMTGCQSVGAPITEKETIKYDNTKEILIDSSSSDVFVIPEDRDNIYVEFETYEKGQYLEIRDGSRVEIKTRSDLDFGITLGGTDYRLYVYVPREYSQELTVDLSSGDVHIDNMDLEVIDLHLSSGDVKLNNINANSIVADLSSGDIVFDNVTCKRLETDLSSGNIELERFIGDIKGKSSSGDINVEYIDKMGNIDYRLSSGEVVIDYRHVEVDGEFDLSTSSGDIEMDMSLDEYERLEEDRVVGSNGKKTYQIVIDTSSGDITIKD